MATLKIEVNLDHDVFTRKDGSFNVTALHALLDFRGDIMEKRDLEKFKERQDLVPHDYFHLAEYENRFGYALQPFDSYVAHVHVTD